MNLFLQKLKIFINVVYTIINTYEYVNILRNTLSQNNTNLSRYGLNGILFNKNITVANNSKKYAELDYQIKSK